MKAQIYRANTPESWRYQMELAYRHGQKLLADGPVDIRVMPAARHRTDPQRQTLWMWHGQVASELTIRTGRRWTKDDVHELVFLERWMPVFELPLPDGSGVLLRHMRTSDKQTPDTCEENDPRKVITNAMDQYLAWITEMGIEVTVPDPVEWR